MARTTWTHDLRVRVFRSLREEFGPYREWHGSLPQGGKAALDVFLGELAREIGPLAGNPALTADAVGNQARWAFSNSSSRHQNHFRNMVVNCAAAIYAGFMDYRDLPGEATMLREEEED